MECVYVLFACGRSEKMYVLTMYKPGKTEKK